MSTMFYFNLYCLYFGFIIFIIIIKNVQYFYNCTNTFSNHKPPGQSLYACLSSLMGGCSGCARVCSGVLGCGRCVSERVGVCRRGGREAGGTQSCLPCGFSEICSTMGFSSCVLPITSRIIY